MLEELIGQDYEPSKNCETANEDQEQLPVKGPFVQQTTGHMIIINPLERYSDSIRFFEARQISRVGRG